MRRNLALALAALALAAITAPAGAKKPDATGQAKFDVKPKSLAGTCVDIKDGVGRYNSILRVVIFEEYTWQPSCADVTYTFSVYDASGQSLLAHVEQAGTGEEYRTIEGPTGYGILRFIVALGTQPAGETVCVVGSSKTSKVHDRAPNSGCVALTYKPVDTNDPVGYLLADPTRLLGAPGSSPWS